MTLYIKLAHNASKYNSNNYLKMILYTTKKTLNPHLKLIEPKKRHY